MSPGKGQLHSCHWRAVMDLTICTEDKSGRGNPFHSKLGDNTVLYSLHGEEGVKGALYLQSACKKVLYTALYTV